jgi:hypothetical protein
MFSIEEFITAVFCCVDDLLSEIAQQHPLRTKGFTPALSDSEVLTMEIVAESQGIDTDCGMWRYFRQHWLALFPQLGSRTTLARQAANLWQYKALVQARLAEAVGGLSADVHLIDGLPLPVCGFSRAPRCQRFQGEASYGYCAAKKQTYYVLHRR